MDPTTSTVVIAGAAVLGFFLAFTPIARLFTSGVIGSAKAVEVARKAEADARAESERIRAAQEEMDARLNRQRALLDDSDRRIARLRQALDDAERYVVECIQAMQRAGVTPPTRRYAHDPPGRIRAHSLAEFIAEYFTDEEITIMFADFRVSPSDSPQASTLIRAHKFTLATRGADANVRKYLIEKRPALVEELQEVV